jgi:hypothetical protein
MRIPLKINCNISPLWLKIIFPIKNDPRNLFKPNINSDSFEGSISSIKIDSTWKSTTRRRHPLTDSIIIELTSCFKNLSILEVGSSSGSASLELLDRLAGIYKQYYFTDLFFTIPYKTQDNATYFYHPKDKHCIIIVTDCFIVYEDIQDAIFPLGFLANRILSFAPKFDPVNISYASMLHPELKRRAEYDPKIIVMEYDIFNVWSNEMVDIIKIANVLNRLYFSDEEIKIAIANLKNIIKVGGKLIITDNRDVEKVSMFFKTQEGKLIIEKELNGGTDISFIVKEV